MSSDVDNFGLKMFNEQDLGTIRSLGIAHNHISILTYHRGFDTVDFSSDTYFIYTGRGPSKAEFHIGHLPALKLCLELQKHLTEKIEFMIADDEKIFRDGIDINTMTENVNATLKQLGALGFNSTNTHFRINSDGFSSSEYEILISIMRIVSINTLNHIFGEKQNLGEYFYPLVQILPCFSKSRKCIIVAGIDQDPFFRLARDIARRLNYHPPVIIYTKSVPGLDGSAKMSTSVPSSLPIFLGESNNSVSEKISKIKVVGAGSLDELFEKGADLTKDVPYRLLTIFDSNIQNVELITKAYTLGLTASEDILALQSIIDSKGIKQRNQKVMLTSFGIRTYLTTVLTNVVSLNENA